MSLRSLILLTLAVLVRLREVKEPALGNWSYEVLVPHCLREVSDGRGVVFYGF